MSHNRLRAGAGTLSTAANHVSEARVDLDRLGARLRQEIEGLRSYWDGMGAAAFVHLGQRWDERQRIIVRALDDFQQSLQATERDNTSTDESVRSHFDRFTSRLS